MSQKTDQKLPTEPQVTIEEVNRVLEVGSLLRSVLTEEELEELQSMLSETKDLQSQEEQQIGNAGVT